VEGPILPFPVRCSNEHVSLAQGQRSNLPIGQEGRPGQFLKGNSVPFILFEKKKKIISLSLEATYLSYPLP
jgi:hypothetical protein